MKMEDIITWLLTVVTHSPFSPLVLAPLEAPGGRQFRCCRALPGEEDTLDDSKVAMHCPYRWPWKPFPARGARCSVHALGRGHCYHKISTVPANNWRDMVYVHLAQGAVGRYDVTSGPTDTTCNVVMALRHAIMYCHLVFR